MTAPHFDERQQLELGTLARRTCNHFRNLWLCLPLLLLFRPFQSRSPCGPKSATDNNHNRVGPIANTLLPEPQRTCGKLCRKVQISVLARVSDQGLASWGRS